VGLHCKPQYEQCNFIALLWMLCREVTKKNDWNKGAWIILWWVEVMEYWTSGGLSMSGDYSVIFIQKARRDFLHFWYYGVGTVLSKVSVPSFFACFLKKMLNLRSFTACLFSFNPWIIEQKKNFLLLQNWVYCTHILKIIFSTFFLRFD